MIDDSHFARICLSSSCPFRAARAIARTSARAACVCGSARAAWRQATGSVPVLLRTQLMTLASAVRVELGRVAALHDNHKAVEPRQPDIEHDGVVARRLREIDGYVAAGAVRSRTRAQTARAR